MGATTSQRLIIYPDRKALTPLKNIFLSPNQEIRDVPEIANYKEFLRIGFS